MRVSFPFHRSIFDVELEQMTSNHTYLDLVLANLDAKMLKLPIDDQIKICESVNAELKDRQESERFRERVNVRARITKALSEHKKTLNPPKKKKVTKKEESESEDEL